jgi:hypothetical protein
MPDVIGPSTTGTNSPIARVRPVRQQSVEKGLWIKKHPPSFLERRKLGTRQSRRFLPRDAQVKFPYTHRGYRYA